MKKVIMMAAMMMAVISATAQGRFEPGTLTIQPRIGATAAMLTNAPNLNAAEFGYSGNIDATPTGGGFVGVDLEYQIAERLSFSAGANWSNAGSGWENTDFVEKGGQTVKMRDFKIETEYVFVPMTVNFYIARGLALKSGVQLGFLTKAKAKCSLSGGSHGSNMTVDLDEDIKDAFNKFDVSIPVGLSYEFKSPFVIDARYNIGLSKVNKEPMEDGKDTRNGIFTLTFGYKFSL